MPAILLTADVLLGIVPTELERAASCMRLVHLQMAARDIPGLLALALCLVLLGPVLAQQAACNIPAERLGKISFAPVKQFCGESAFHGNNA